MRPSGEPVKPRLFYALSKLIPKHPILSAIPVALQTPNPYFVRLPEIVLDKAVTFVEEDASSSSSDWQEVLDKVLEQQHNQPFESQPTEAVPFWRICVIESKNAPEVFALVFMFHHSLMDTKSALSLHKEIEGYMAQYTKGDRINIVHSSSEALIPPLEELYALPVSQEFIRSQETYNEPPPGRWTGAPQFIPVTTRFSSLWLSETLSKELVMQSKKERTSVTATLQTLIATSIFSILPPTYTALQADCAVSLRTFLPKPVTLTTLGCYVGSLSTTYSREPSFNWDEARRTKTAIEHGMAQKGADMPVGYLARIPNQHHWILQKLGRKRMSAFELSNVGASGTRQGTSSFRIESMLFSQSASACSAAIKVSAVTGPDGRLALGFTWQEGVIDSDMVERIKEFLSDEVQRLAMSGYVP
jgi:hypothetical protein